jgi:hypothetical protein
VGLRAEKALTFFSRHFPFVGAGSFSLPSVPLRTSPDGQAPVRFADGLRVVEHDLPAAARPGERLFLGLDWEAYAQPKGRYVAYAHLLDDRQASRAGVDREILHAALTTDQWRPGQQMADRMILDLPADLPPGGYQVQVGLYSQADKVPLPLVDEAGEPVEDRLLIPLLVQPHQPLPLAQPVEARFGDELALVALEPAAEAPVRAGEPLTVTLRWQALRKPARDYTVFVHLVRDGEILAQADGQPFGGRVPMGAWPVGQPVDTPYVLQLPEDLPPGPLQLQVGLYDLASGQRLPVSGGADLAAGDHVAWPLASTP